jgi:hypothetical protein
MERVNAEPVVAWLKLLRGKTIPSKRLSETPEHRELNKLNVLPLEHQIIRCYPNNGRCSRSCEAGSPEQFTRGGSQADALP